MRNILFLLPFMVFGTFGQDLSARETYDSISRMLTGFDYPSIWWEERSACLASLDPGVEVGKAGKIDCRTLNLLPYFGI